MSERPVGEQEPAYVRLERIQRMVSQGLPLDILDQKFLLVRMLNAEQMLIAQQGAVEDAGRHWHKIGYDEGYAEAAQDSMSDPDEDDR